jgi:hypothetical protein
VALLWLGVAAGSVTVRALAVTEPTTVTVSFGTLRPSSGNAPRAANLPVRLAMPPRAAHGYRVNAVATFAFTPSASDTRGRALTASDIGIGVTGASIAGRAEGADRLTLAAGFDYDPSAVTRRDRSTPYGGASSGRATLADLLGGREILRGDKPSGDGDLIVTLTLGVLSQFVTPGTFAGTITLTVSAIA